MSGCTLGLFGLAADEVQELVESGAVCALVQNRIDTFNILDVLEFQSLVLPIRTVVPLLKSGSSFLRLLLSSTLIT